jgi:FtsZ-binding cell division protein ZapB
MLTVFMTATALLTAASAPQEPDRISAARSELEQWVETQRIISAEQRDWELGRQVLNDRIEIVQREIEALRLRIREAGDSIAAADAKRAELVAENEKLKEASSALDGTIIALEGRTRELLPQLPDPIRERIKPLSQSIPAEAQETKLPLAERFQNVVGILNAVNKFQREISLTSEVRELGDGTRAEVTVAYLGIGRAFYASADGRSAGTGAGTADGWAWQSIDEAAAEVARFIAILKNEATAAFVRMPIRIE